MIWGIQSHAKLKTETPPQNQPWGIFYLKIAAGLTGLEPATSSVTGKRSNQTELQPQGYLDFIMTTGYMLKSKIVNI